VGGGVSAIDATARFSESQDSGSYRDAGGHHVHQKAAFKGNRNYNEHQAFSISQEYMECRGWDHEDMSAAQRWLQDALARSGRPNTIFEQNSIAIEALTEGGATEEEARKLVAESLHNLRAQGATTPARIPWH